jgi:hypothetical protein
LSLNPNDEKAQISYVQFLVAKGLDQEAFDYVKVDYNKDVALCLYRLILSKWFNTPTL